MGRAFETIDERTREFIESLPVFFVATAPDNLPRPDNLPAPDISSVAPTADNLTRPPAPDNAPTHINISPKGLDSFRVLSETQVAYLDLTGSGAETIAHLRQNGRITIMFTAFSGKPLIVRLYGKGEVILPDSKEFPELMAHFTDMSGIRSIIRVDVTRVSNSCGFGVPLMKLEKDRDELLKWSDRKGKAGIAEYQSQKNAKSIDGLPALDFDA